MPVTFNHSILAAHDRHESARFLANILGLAEPTSWGPFAEVQLDAGVSIQFAEPPVEEIQMQHYAFLVDDDRFDEILARAQALGVPYTADPNPSRPPADQHEPRWTRLLLPRPVRPRARGPHPPMRLLGSRLNATAAGPSASRWLPPTSG
jgi:catechol 2,3-dioxygenase-like lactoylglutathione lyase family enzyme